MDHTWYLFRHALATRSTSGYGDQVLTASILPDSAPPIRRLAYYLIGVPDSHNVSSELLRCRQTTDIIFGISGKRFITDARLNEYYDISFPDFKTNVESFISDMKSVQKQNILICTHGAVIGAMKHAIIGDTISEDHLNDYTQCGELMIIKDKDIAIRDFNKEVI